MRITLRFLIPLILILALTGYAFLPLFNRLVGTWHERDLQIRAQLIAKALDGPIQESFLGVNEERGLEIARKKLRPSFDTITQDERLSGLMVCDERGQKIVSSGQFFPAIECETPELEASSSRLRSGKAIYYVTRIPILVGVKTGTLVVVHDLSFASFRSQRAQIYLVYLFVFVGLVVAIFTFFVSRVTAHQWFNLFRRIIRGDLPGKRSAETLRLQKEVNYLIRELDRNRQLKEEGTQVWSPDSLRTILKNDLTGDEVLIVSNREPYIHNRNKDGHVVVQVPASGLVTALEPVMRACSGTWIAHGSGSADRDVVDGKDHIRVPPEDPSYQIRRIWLTKEEEEGYYFGFANEGLWPLCHIAHTRPIFRSADFAAYRQVNQKFADAVVEEAKTDNPVILVQDYHFALLPKMIREKLPRATIITFWHIPWPNAESFGICPWKQEILEGLLGSSILGFHTRFHCNNFLEAVDRYLESRIHRDDLTVSYAGQLTAIRSYPISIDWPPRWLKGQKPIEECRRAIRERHGLDRQMRVGIGVDRMDYTKGILERFAAVERLFELKPEWIGKLAFIQIAAPTRSTIPQYRHFSEEMHLLVDRINSRFGHEGYKPIILLDRHHEPSEIFEYFRGSEFCFVSSLHDGMNLVAKEYAAARDDDQGVLILSQFTGAARELPEALIVNPYDSDQCADAIDQALRMPPEQQAARMRNMRTLIQENNVFRWAARMLLDAARIRQRSIVLGLDSQASNR